METITDQQLQQQSDSNPTVEAVASQVSSTVETIPVAEVQKWLTEQIQPYLKRIERLEEIESKKDSQIHCMELALQRFQELIDQAKLAAPIAHNKATNGVKTPLTAAGNGQKRPQTAAQPDTKEEKKPTVKPTVTKHVGTDHKPTTTGARPNTAAGLTSTEKKDDDEKKTPAVVPHKVVRTPIKKDETKGDEEKKETDKKIEKKPTTATATTVKKEGEKDDKKTNAHPIKTPVISSTVAATEKKPAGTSITGTPKPAVKKEDPKIKKDAGKEVTTGVKDEKKPISKPNGVKPIGAKGKEEPKKITEKKEEQAVVKPEEKEKGKVADPNDTQSELPAAISEVIPPTTIQKQVHEDEQLLDSKEPQESKPAEAEKPTLPAEEEEESI